MPIVYMARTRDGKVYVGCTSKGLELRKMQHAASAANGSPYKFHRAIREMGMSQFAWEIVGNFKTMQEAFAVERSLIAKYNSFRTGYNSSPGGKGSKMDGARTAHKMAIKPIRDRRRLLYR